MPDFCAAYGCSNERSLQTRTSGITFHRFPKSRERRRQWELALRRDDFVANNRSLLCSDHFQKEDFDRTGQTVRLKAGAVPKIFNFPAHLQRPIATRSTAASRRAEENLPEIHQDECPPDVSTSLESKSTSLEWKMSTYKEQMEMLIKYLRTGRYPTGLDKAQKRNIRNQTKNHFLDSNNQLMYRKTATLSLKVVVCPAEVKDILQQYHVSPMGGHSGINTTMGKIVQHYWWQAMKTDVIEYVSTCPNCQTYKKLKSQAPELKCITVNKPLELVGMDLMGPYPETARGHRYILMFTDYFTKFMDFFPLSTKSAQGVAEGIKTFVSQWGTPARLLLDQGREFVAEVNTAVCAEFGIKHTVTSAYHPQTNGLDERSNQTLKVRLSKLVNDQQNNWDDYLHNLAAPKDENDEKPVTLTLNTSDTSHNETSSSSDVLTLPPASPARISAQPPPDPVHEALLHRQTKLNLYTSFTNYLSTVLQELPEAEANKLMKDIHRQMTSYM